MKKYGNAGIWHSFTDLFDFLTLSVIIDNQLFAVHGGLSPSLHSIDELLVLDRFQEVPHDGPIADMMWSDPDPDKEDFALSQRGAGYTFGSRVVKHFLHSNKLTHIFRAHQLCMEGFQVLFDDSLTTVWSAPNYCYRCGNQASIVQVDEQLRRFVNVYGPAPENDKEIQKQVYIG